MKRITVDLLKEMYPCASQMRTFKKVFPKGAPVSMRSLLRAQKAGLNVSWLERFLCGPARAEYGKVVGPAKAKYEKARGLAWAEYKKVVGPAWAEYEKARCLAGAECEKVIGLALVAALAAEEKEP